MISKSNHPISSVFFWLIVLIISPHVHAQSKIFKNKDGHYEITFPESWRLRVEGTTTDLLAPSEGEYDVWEEFVGVSLAESNGLSLTEAFSYYIKEDFPAYYTNFKIINQGEESLSGQKSKWVLYSFSNSTKKDAATLFNLFYLIEKNNTLYSLNAIAEKSGYPKLESDFLTIIRSFRIHP